MGGATTRAGRATATSWGVLPLTAPLRQRPFAPNRNAYIVRPCSRAVALRLMTHAWHVMSIDAESVGLTAVTRHSLSFVFGGFLLDSPCVAMYMQDPTAVQGSTMGELNWDGHSCISARFRRSSRSGIWKLVASRVGTSGGRKDESRSLREPPTVRRWPY
eukprot:SAG25_NODE_544_length_7044_cov_3.670122_8_plen_160_part_00